MTVPNIMVVEDEAIIATDLRRMLEGLNYRVAATAGDGAEAIALAHRHRPDLVLMDIRLDNDMDGVEVAEHLRDMLRTPVVYLTAHTDEATLSRAKATGPHGFLVKPVMERELRVTVEVALARAAMDRQVAAHEQWLSTVVASVAEGIVVTDRNGDVGWLNRAAERLVGRPLKEAEGRPLEEVLQFCDEHQFPVFQNLLLDVMVAGVKREWTGGIWLQPVTGARLPVEFTAAPLRKDGGLTSGMVLVLRDVTARQQLETEREKLIRSLREALDQVQTLSGLLPICSYCKRIRKDNGYWEEVERYISDRSAVRFSHGICPDCLRRDYPEIADEIITSVEEDERKRDGK